MEKLRLLSFGGCNLRGPLARAARPALRHANCNWEGVPETVALVGPPFWTYTFGEVFQALGMYRGERYVPADIRTLCSIGPNFSPNVALGVKNVDVVLFEPATSLEIEFEGFHLNRAPILKVLDVLKRHNPAAGKLASTWYSRGIVRCDGDVCRAVAKDLRPFVADSELDNKDLVLAMLANARGTKRDVHLGMKRLASVIDLPLGIVTYTWQYMVDGRAISWPAEFHKQVLEAAAECGLSVLEPKYSVLDHGVLTAMKRDLRHYKAEFEPVIAKSIIDFAYAVKEGASSRFDRSERRQLSIAS